MILTRLAREASVAESDDFSARLAKQQREQQQHLAAAWTEFSAKLPVVSPSVLAVMRMCFFAGANAAFGPLEPCIDKSQLDPIAFLRLAAMRAELDRFAWKTFVRLAAEEPPEPDDAA
jgi:hypothetical protein